MSRRFWNNFGFFGFLAAVATLVIYVGNDYLIHVTGKDDPSISGGTVSNGGLVHGKRLPSKGPNFETYSRLGSLVGRTCVHHSVRDSILAAYETVFLASPDIRFVYGETGWCKGGEFDPHRTHQNGLSVDFMVPVRRHGLSVPLPTWPWQKWGYNHTFNAVGKMDDYTIDFDAMAAHLNALNDAAKKHDLKIELVILEPELQPLLFKATDGAKLKKLPFKKDAAWVPHDDHYHVDFGLPR